MKDSAAVVLKRCEVYDLDKIKSLILEMMDQSGISPKALAGGDKKVVIKPNLVEKRSPEGAATTHPFVLEAVIEIFKEYTSDITVAECPGGTNTQVYLDAVFKGTGIKDVCDRTGVKLNYDMTSVPLTLPDGTALKELNVLKAMAEADVFINIGKFKTHSLTTLTGAAKNLYGVIPGLGKIEQHARFHELGDFCKLVCDINRMIKPDLCIMDAVMIMEGNGPTAGRPRSLGYLGLSDSAFALDDALCSLVSLDPEDIPILSEAKRQGLYGGYTLYGTDDEEIEKNRITDLLLPDSKRGSPITKFTHIFGGRLSKWLAPRPYISPKRCVGCGECIKLCPKKAITVKKGKNGKYAVIDKKECIRCYCCQELCPKKAVDTKTNPIVKL